MKKILIIEDDVAIAMALEDDFKYEGFDVTMAYDGKKGLESSLNHDIDIIIMDIMLPGMDGFDICKSIRASGYKTPIIMLTAKGQEIDKVLGLEFGADDYVTKPYSSRELKARVKALMRRTESNVRSPINKVFQFGNIVVDFNSYVITKDGVHIKLTALEFSILKFFLLNPGKVLKRDEILDEIWEDDVIVNPRTVDTHVANLRRKLEDDASNPRWLHGVRGIGYRFITN